jgi:hypothetical protein
MAMRVLYEDSDVGAYLACADAASVRSISARAALYARPRPETSCQGDGVEELWVS